MELCYSGHAEVCYSSKIPRPVCEMIKERVDLQTEFDNREDEIEGLNEAVAELTENWMKSMIFTWSAKYDT